ncbi:ThiF family adenylyltransferase [Nocardia otitidiscaviarum]|nr:ThiF family adenylyltransferase [Nocardia otitidiscaviarum]
MDGHPLMIEILHPATDRARITALRATASGYRFVDGWTSALPELLAIRHPRLAGRRHGGADDFAALAAMAQAAGSLDEISRYIVYPWRRVLVRLPDAEHFHRLRTARNRWLITAEEQRLWSSALIGVAGLSVGASVLTACSLTGARRFRLAEHDTLGPTNLNRLPASVCDLGEPKLLLAQRRIWEIDPYTEIATYSKGYRTHDASAFLGRGPGRLAVVVEEMDDLAMKVDIRVRARAARIPVVMATDHGDGAFLDVERYDLEPDAPLFGGRAGDLTADRAALTDPARRLEIVHAIVGDAVSPRTRASLAEVGRTLPTWPQLGTAVGVAGALAAAAARAIVCGAPMPSGRYRVDPDELTAAVRA